MVQYEADRIIQRREKEREGEKNMSV